MHMHRHKPHYSLSRLSCAEENTTSASPFLCGMAASTTARRKFSVVTVQGRLYTTMCIHKQGTVEMLLINSLMVSPPSLNIYDITISHLFAQFLNDLAKVYDAMKGVEEDVVGKLLPQNSHLLPLVRLRPVNLFTHLHGNQGLLH